MAAKISNPSFTDNSVSRSDETNRGQAASTPFVDAIPRESCDWIRGLRARFAELTSLPRGWDGYGGSPVSRSCAVFAIEILERIYRSDVQAPQLVPGGDGTLQLEWHDQGFDIELEIMGANKVVATRYDHHSEQEEELTLEADITMIDKWMEELSSRVGKGVHQAPPAAV